MQTAAEMSTVRFTIALNVATALRDAGVDVVTADFGGDSLRVDVRSKADSAHVPAKHGGGRYQRARPLRAPGALAGSRHGSGEALTPERPARGLIPGRLPMPTHTAAVIRWCALLASTASTSEEAARWRELAERAQRRSSTRP